LDGRGITSFGNAFAIAEIMIIARRKRLRKNLAVVVGGTLYATRKPDSRDRSFEADATVISTGNHENYAGKG